MKGQAVSRDDGNQARAPVERGETGRTTARNPVWGEGDARRGSVPFAPLTGGFTPGEANTGTVILSTFVEGAETD